MKRTLTLSPTLLPSGFLLLLGALFFVWPVVTGIPDVRTRLLWIALTAPLSLLSAFLVKHHTKNLSSITLALSPITISVSLLACLGLLVYSSVLPPLSFSDELTIAIPGISAAYALAAYLTWPLLFLATIALIIGSLWLFSHPRWSWPLALIVFLGMAGLTIAISLTGITSGIALRYPPVMHLMQILATILTFGIPSLFRTPNILWTALLVSGIWSLTPQWNTKARLAFLAGITLLPMGWIYRITLYQACAEITLVTIIALLTTRIFYSHSSTPSTPLTPSIPYAPLLGITCALWMLTRPTALPGIAAILLILAMFQCRQALIAGSIAIPPILSWFVLSPFYASQYQFDASLPERTFSSFLIQPIINATTALPDNLHPVGLTLLLVTSVLTLLFGTKPHRTLLIIAWLLALTVALPQHILAGEVFQGVGRYNVLLLVPVGVGFAFFFLPNKLPKLLSTAIGTLCILLALLFTPWNLTNYLQQTRATAADIYRMPGEGYLPQPLLSAIEQELVHKDTMVVLAPQQIFLDFLVATKNTTLAQRNAIVERSRAWTQDSPARPVLIQASTTIPYAPNITPEMLERLKDAREWGIQQSHQIVNIGIEETIVVP